MLQVLLPRPRRRVDLVPQVFHQVQHPVRHKQHRVVLQGKERPLGQVVAVLGRLPTCRPVGDDVQGPGCPAAGNWLDRQHRHPEEFKEFLRGFRAVAAGVQGVMLLEKLETPAGLAKGASLARENVLLEIQLQVVPDVQVTILVLPHVRAIRMILRGHRDEPNPIARKAIISRTRRSHWRIRRSHWRTERRFSGRDRRIQCWLRGRLGRRHPPDTDASSRLVLRSVEDRSTIASYFLRFSALLSIKLRQFPVVFSRSFQGSQDTSTPLRRSRGEGILATRGFSHPRRVPLP
mmetsp:Transcript_4107/g.15859  ORF Transcript_4107/g.15859 Transcript_4107/m.15859 type:complete len:291 (-) Transcript_4107:47-919(-)